jgi:hypothetical protein
MKKCIPFLRFMQELFDSLLVAQQATEIAQAILEVKSLRMTEIAHRITCQFAFLARSQSNLR